MSRKKSSEGGLSKVVKSTIAGMFIGCMVCALLLWLTSLVFVKSGVLPISIIGVAVVIMAGVSSFLGAYFAIKISKSNGLVVGAATGALIFMVTLIAGAITSANADATATLSRAAVMITAGCIGGVVAVNRSPKHRR